ncbi:MAG TPA: peptide ABC transporter substrate-binding protein [Gemmataceae bacterium]|nr:peptide ABC transporter substrate-binding protein [Gemmataceae bacterium]
MKFRLRDAYLVCGFCALLGFLVVAGEGRRSLPKERPATDTLVVATTREPETLHPVLGVNSMAAVEIFGALFEPLTVYDDRHRLVPCLATEVPSLENGGLQLCPREKDWKMKTVWHLLPDARWSDGVPVTADDFKFTYRLIMDADVPAVSRELEERIFKMESHASGRTLVVFWKEPYAFAQEGHRHLVVPRHIEEPRFNGLSAEERKQYERTPFNRQPVGNGPYRLAEWALGRYLVLERQPYWHGPEPPLRRLIYRFIPEGETVLANLDTGRVGAVSPVALDYDLAVEFDQRAQARGDGTYVMDYQPGLWWEHIDFNTENPITADKRVRQALTAGLNRQAICQALFAGRSSVTDTWLPPLHPAAFPPHLPRYPYDRQRATDLLEAAGWRVGPGGLRFKDGRPLRLTLTYTAGEPLTDRMAQMAKEDWRLLGVELNLRPVDSQKFAETSAESRAYQGLSLYAWVMDPSADGMTFWTSDNIPTDENPNGQNTCRWRNARSDRLLTAATRTLDPKSRRELMWREQRIWTDELPAIPLFFRQEISVHHRDLLGWRPTGTDTPVTWNCYEWRWGERK